MFYVIMESDLNHSSTANVIFKYADDTNLLIRADSDVSVELTLRHMPCRPT